MVYNKCALRTLTLTIFFIFLGYFPSTSYSANTNHREQDLSTYKEIAQIRLESTRDIIQKDIQALSSRLDTQDKRLDTQNSHIDQNLSLLGILLSVLAILLPLAGLVGYVSVSRKARVEAQLEARKEAKVSSNEWFGVHASELQSRLDGLQENLQTLEIRAEAGFNLHIQRVQDGADLAIKEIQLSVSGHDTFKTNISETSANALAEAATAAKNKPESKYTFTDWNNRAFDAYSKGDIERAARFWRDAAEVNSATPQQVSLALYNAGVAMSELKRYEQAIEIHDDIIKRFDGKQIKNMESTIAEALNGKASCLGLLGRHEEADLLLDAIIARLEKDEKFSHSEYMAHALINKIIGLSIKKLYAQVLKLCEHFLERFDKAESQEIVKHLITVRSQKIGALKVSNREDEINNIYNRTIAQFGESNDPEIIEEIGKIKTTMAYVFICQAKEKWTDSKFRIKTLYQAAALLNEAIIVIPHIAVVYGNQAYCAHLLGEDKKFIIDKLTQGLILDGPQLYAETLDDLLIHPIPEKDHIFRVMLEEVWGNVKARSNT